MNMPNPSTLAIGLRPVQDTAEDLEFLYRVYASTRTEEMVLIPWHEKEKEDFLRMQFNLQHEQYRSNYHFATFDIILCGRIPAGRLYVDRRPGEIRIIDIALLPEFRRRGAGRRIMAGLLEEADQKQLPLTLHVEMNNPASGFYERLGFERKDLKGIYYYMVRPPAAGR